MMRLIFWLNRLWHDARDMQRPTVALKAEWFDERTEWE